MKDSFSLLEVILSIMISSIVIINSTYFSKELFQTNKTIQNIEILKLDLLSTKIFLQKNNTDLVNKLSYENDTLYYENKILLEKVSSFNITKNMHYYEINLEIKDLAKEYWKIRL